MKNRSAMMASMRMDIVFGGMRSITTAKRCSPQKQEAGTGWMMSLISGTFSAMNLLTLYGNEQRAAMTEQFNVIMPGKKRANECVKCGTCEQACPQHIAIRDRLEEAAKALRME